MSSTAPLGPQFILQSEFYKRGPTGPKEMEPEWRKVRIFIGGPITPTGRVNPSTNEKQNQVAEFLDNVRQGITTAAELIHHGFAPYCPFVDFMYWFARNPETPLPTGNTMQTCDLSWLVAADALLLLPGWETSSGVKGELARANELGIPVFYSIAELIEYFGDQALINGERNGRR